MIRQRADPVRGVVDPCAGSFIAGQETPPSPRPRDGRRSPAACHPSAVRQRGAGPTDTGEQRRDPRPARPDHPLRTGLVPGDRHRRRARKPSAHRVRCGVPARRDERRPATRSRPRCGSPCGAAGSVRSAGRRLSRRLGALAAGHRRPATTRSDSPYDAAPGAGVLVALPRRRCGFSPPPRSSPTSRGRTPVSAVGAERVAYAGRSAVGARDRLADHGTGARDQPRGRTRGRPRRLRPPTTVRLVRSCLRVFSAGRSKLYRAGRAPPVGERGDRQAAGGLGPLPGRGLCLEPPPELLTADDWGYPRSFPAAARPSRGCCRGCPPTPSARWSSAHGSPCGSRRIPASPVPVDPDRPVPARPHRCRDPDDQE